MSKVDQSASVAIQSVTVEGKRRAQVLADGSQTIVGDGGITTSLQAVDVQGVPEVGLGSYEWDYGPAHLLNDWTVAGSITQESDGIVLEQGGNGITLLLDRMSFVPDKDYELKFEVAEDSANFGAIIYFGNLSGTGAYVPDVATDLADHTVTISSNYITDNGIYHRRVSPPADLSEYRLRIVRNGAHTGTQKLKNISAREL